MRLSRHKQPSKRRVIARFMLGKPIGFATLLNLVDCKRVMRRLEKVDMERLINQDVVMRRFAA